MGCFTLSALGRRVEVCCDHPEAEQVLRRTHERFLVDGGEGPFHLSYRVHLEGEGACRLQRVGASSHVSPLSELPFAFDTDLIVSLQRERDDLFFLHAGVVERKGIAGLVVGHSGAGKSTLTWTLVNEGLRYSSDELAPIAIAERTVEPFPRALCLKAVPPGRHPLPAAAFRSGRLTYIPTSALPSAPASAPLQLGPIFFVRREGEGSTPLSVASVGEAAARIYAETLNALAHPADGLDGAIEVAASSAGCFMLDTSDLEAAAAAVIGVLEKAATGSRAR